MDGVPSFSASAMRSGRVARIPPMGTRLRAVASAWAMGRVFTAHFRPSDARGEERSVTSETGGEPYQFSRRLAAVLRPMPRSRSSRGGFGGERVWPADVRRNLPSTLRP